jgi:hypothetical protein
MLAISSVCQKEANTKVIQATMIMRWLEQFWSLGRKSFKGLSLAPRFEVLRISDFQKSTSQTSKRQDTNSTWITMMQRIISTAARGPLGRRASVDVRLKSSSLQANLGRRFEAQYKQGRRSFSDVTKHNSELAKTSNDGVVGFPIDFDVQSKVEGSESQIVTIALEPGQVLRAESGAMMYMTDGVEMNTITG